MLQKGIFIHSFDETLPGIDIAYFSGQDQPANLNSTMGLPHRHDFYSCFFLQKGNLNLQVDFDDLTMTAGSLLITYPGQVHQFSSVPSTDFIGWGLAIKTELIDHKIRAAIECSLTKIALLNLDKANQSWFTTIFNLIKMSGTDVWEADNRKAELIQSLVHAFMLKASDVLQASEKAQIRVNSSRRIELTKQFKLLIKQNHIRNKKPADYAALLNITVSHLNETVKIVTGFPTSYFIQQEIVVEAQRLLVYSALSVKEIAYHLGYDDYKYFIRLFGKFLGMSPSVFRNKNQQARILD